MHLYCSWCGSRKHNQTTCPKLHSFSDCNELDKMKKQGKFDGFDLKR